MIRACFRPGLPVILLLIATAADGATGSRRDAESELGQIRGRITDLQKSIKSAESQRSATAASLKKSEQAIARSQAELQRLAGESRTVQERLIRLKRNTAGSSQALTAQRDRLSALLRQQYRRGEPQALQLVLSGVNPNEIARDLYYLARIAHARRDVISELKQNLSRLDSLQKETLAAAEELKNIVQAQESERSRLEAEKRERGNLLAKLSRDIRNRQQEVAVLRRDEGRLTALIRRLTEAARKPAPAQGRRRATNERTPFRSSGKPFNALRGTLALPLRGELGGRFGSPRAGGGITWKGIFIAAKSGSEVRAVADGRVVYADQLRGYGNLLIMDHGDNYLTLYAFGESLLKREGDVVRGGETIATAGSSSGHEESGLYFEMRLEGKPFDPMSWVQLR